ncbi:hypothetical protein [Pokkaliibacter sp. CJK22405]|uniref:hypothetical protein n=1 Tax=Pokkaliibacter sp. CJK22405 TaxID=3384615 RepID=UPI003984AE5C
MAVINPVALRQVEAADRQLGTSLQQGSGAQFAWLMSWWDNHFQDLDKAPEEPRAAATQVQGYTPELVEQMGSFMQSGQQGAMALTLSWLATRPESTNYTAEPEMDIRSAGFLSQNPMLTEILQSQSQLQTSI